MMTDSPSIRNLPLVAVIVLLMALAVWIVRVNSVTVNGNEAQAMWVVRDHPLPNADLTGRARYDLDTLADRIQQQPQPPLYFLLLDGWQLVTGTSQLALMRVLSLLFAVGAAITAGYMAIGVQVRASWRSLSPTVLILTLLVLLVPAIRADVYALVAMTALLAFWRLMRLRENTSVVALLLYFVTLILALFSAHVALVLIPLHGVAAIMRGQWRRVLPVMILAVLVYLGWLIVADQGIDDVLLNWRSVTLMLFVVIVSLIPAMLAFIMTIPNTPRLLQRLIPLIGLVVIVWLLWLPGQPAYIDVLLAERDPAEPVIYDFPPDHSLNMLNTQPETHLTAGLSIDIGWRNFSGDELDIVIDSVADAESIWLMLPEDNANWDDLVAALSADYETGYDRREDGFRFVRLDRR